MQIGYVRVLAFVREPTRAPRRPTILTKRGSSYDDIVRMDAKVAHFSLTFAIL